MFKLPFLKAKYLQPRFLMVIFLVIIVGFSFAGVANAGGISDAVATFLGWIVYGIVFALGKLLVLLMEALIWLAQWNNFIYAPAVELGWKIVRDICNMFFVVIMLIIAFATILRVKDYSYEKLLPKLIIMAILINFSKMICGLLIDVSQVVMLTFVNSFKDVAGANLTTILGLDKLTSMEETEKGADVTSWSIMGAYVLALVYVIIALITIATMVIMLAVRIVMIWIYTVLSPLAYLMGAFPAGKKYSSKWWGDFTSNLIIGPVLAFFIWLSFAALGTGQDVVGTGNIAKEKPSASGIASDTSGSITQAGSPDNMLNFVISIAMLYGGLTIAKSIGGAAGGIASKGMNAINKGVVRPVTAGAAGAYAFSKRKAIAGAVGAGKFAGRSVKTGLGTLDRVAGAQFDKARMKKGVLSGTSFAQKGLFSTTGAFAVNKTQNKVDSIKQKIRGDKEVQEKLFQYNEDEKRFGKGMAVLEHDGKKFKNENGKMKEWDEKAGSFVPGGEIYKNKFGKEVSVSGVFGDSLRQSVRKHFGKANDAKEKKKEEDILKIQKNILSSGESENEMFRRLQNGSTSANDKMALAMALAVKGGFKDAAQVQLAQKAVANNPGMSKKFNDEIDKTQAHLAYDFNNVKDVAKFKKRIDSGKINISSFQADAYKDANLQQAIKEHYGEAEFDRIINSVANRGKKYSEAVGKGALENRRIDSAGKITNSSAAVLHAKVTGDINESFTINSETGPAIDTNALSQYLNKAGAANLNKVTKEDMEKLIKSSDSKTVDMILSKLTSGKLKSMYRIGNNDELVEYLVKLQKSSGNQKTKDAIDKDSELSQID